MHKLQILGMGPGSKEFISPAVISKIKDANIVIGGKRHFQEIQEEVSKKEQYFLSSDFDDLLTFIRRNRDKKIAILVSGDTGFYSLLVFLKKHFLKEELEVVAGLSSMQYMFAKVALSWENAVIKSLHGKKFDYIKALEEIGLVGVLTDNINTPQNIAQKLLDRGYLNININIYVGENLSYENEKITKTTIKELSKVKNQFAMNVVILEKEQNVSYQR